jgi:hypothetical protein
MESDSELNIAHHRPEISQPARKALWDLHTGNAIPQRIADMSMKDAFRAWSRVLQLNSWAKATGAAPFAALSPFMRVSPKRSNQD